MEITRKPDEMRIIKMTPDFTEMAAGSVLIECGRTRVLCTASVVENVPPFKRGTGQGWLTAEYAMLPGSTPTRKERDGLKKDGRGVEIQRLIGRALRGAVDLAGELARLDKEMQKLEKDLAGVNAKLGNEGFVSRAPAEVVARERERAAQLADSREKLTALRQRFAEALAEEA